MSASALLNSCAQLWGSADIVDRDPETRILEDVVYIPYTHADAWGIFDSSGTAISSTVDFRPGNQPSHSQKLTVDLNAVGPIDSAPHGTYVYCGVINPHFGHFIINSLPRYWNVSSIRSPSTPIICHGPGQPGDWLRVPFIQGIMEQLGLRQSDFQAFQRPTRLSRIIVPETSLREQQAGHRAFARFGAEIGNRLTYQSGSTAENRPVYYSKSKLRSAVGVVVNEVEIEDVLRCAGVEIVHPQELSFIDQIKLMNSRNTLIGTAGSFFHASIFTPGRRIICLNVTSQINSNYSIIDALSGNNSQYYFPPAMEVIEPRPGILTSRYLPDARLVAQEITRLI